MAGIPFERGLAEYFEDGFPGFGKGNEDAGDESEDAVEVFHYVRRDCLDGCGHTSALEAFRSWLVVRCPVHRVSFCSGLEETTKSAGV